VSLYESICLPEATDADALSENESKNYKF